MSAIQMRVQAVEYGADMVSYPGGVYRRQPAGRSIIQLAMFEEISGYFPIPVIAEGRIGSRHIRSCFEISMGCSGGVCHYQAALITASH